MKRRPGKKRSEQLPNLRQTGFNFGQELPRTEAWEGPVQFKVGDRSGLMIGAEPLDEYLRRRNLDWIVDFAREIDAMDVSEFVAAYPGGGRPPFHPRILLGLILYGLAIGKTSLRDLEKLAIIDVGAWWLCRGLQPDFTTLCKFISRHLDRLDEQFFVQTTHALVKHLGVSVREVAGDGTVIESAASRFGTMTKEAAEQRAKELEARARLEGNDKLQEAAERLKETAAVAAERDQKRAEKGKAGNARVAPSDPEAVVQKQKNGTTRPSHKPSVMATPQRLVVAAYVHASNESAAVEPMMNQCEAVLGAPMPTLMLDAGYFNEQVLTLSVERELDLLCPSGSLDKTGSAMKGSRSGNVYKTDFVYDATRDVYVCPQGEILVPLRTCKSDDRHGKPRTPYQASAEACRGCPLRDQCTTAKDGGRMLYRYDIDDTKDIMNSIMSHPAAQARYRKRQAMVEPVFPRLRQDQGLNRFRRRGRQKVRAEFFLHVIAYNIRQAVRLGARMRVFCLWMRLDGGPWMPVLAGIAVDPN